MKGYWASRRSLILASLGVAGSTWLPQESAVAQEGGATPEPAASPVGSTIHHVPAGIELENGYVLPRSEPKSGGTLQLDRPGDEIKNFNPAAFEVDPQIPIS